MSSSRRMLGVDTTAAVGDELKASWPEVVGLSLFVAAQKIRGDRPDVQMEVHWVGDHVEPGYDPKRVRLFINRDSIWSIAQTPVVG